MSKKHRGHAKGDPVTYQTPLPAGGVQMETFLPWTLVRRGLKKQVITPLDAPQEFLDEARRERQVREMAQDTSLMRALGLAHHWQRLLDEGRFSSHDRDCGGRRHRPWPSEQDEPTGATGPRSDRSHRLGTP
jgi:hypothetical protein